MKLLRKIYAETLKDFVDFYRMSWIEEKWYRYKKKLPKWDSTDYYILCFGYRLDEEWKHRFRMEAFEERKAKYKKGKWIPNWIRWIFGMEKMIEPVFKPFDADEVRKTARLYSEAEEKRKQELRFLYEYD